MNLKGKRANLAPNLEDDHETATTASPGGEGDPGTTSDPLVADDETQAASAGPDAGDPVASEAGITDPVAGDPVAAEPVVTQPAEPVAAEPVVTEPAEPVAAQPVAAEPVAAEPVVTEPVGADPVVTEPAEPVAAEPVAAEPVVTEPVVTEPVVTEPVAAEPVAAEPVVTDPAASEPAPGDGTPAFEEPPDRPPDDTPDDSSPVPAPRSQRTAVIVLSVLTLIVVGTGVGALVWSRSGDDEAAPPPTTQGTTISTLADAAFTSFTDPETGFTIRYPRGWRRTEAPVRDFRLLATDGRQYSVSVRVVQTQVPTTPDNLANVKAVTDGIVGPDVQLLEHNTIDVNGLIGFRYIYTFTDKDSGLVGAHLHYFLFQGNKMYSIVFEALPTGDFSKIEGIFAQMLESFRVEEPVPGGETPTAPATTPPAPPPSPPR